MRRHGVYPYRPVLRLPFGLMRCDRYLIERGNAQRIKLVAGDIRLDQKIVLPEP